jgi:hypothetical protein
MDMFRRYFHKIAAMGQAPAGGAAKRAGNKGTRRRG